MDTTTAPRIGRVTAGEVRAGELLTSLAAGVPFPTLVTHVEAGIDLNFRRVAVITLEGRHEPILIPRSRAVFVEPGPDAEGGAL